HGITPMANVTPSITVENAAGVTRTSPARPAGRVGHYVADVTFPSAGTWRARISDGFTDAVPHRLSGLEVAAAEPTPFPWPQVVMIAIVALLFGGGWIATVP